MFLIIFVNIHYVLLSLIANCSALSVIKSTTTNTTTKATAPRVRSFSPLFVEVKVSILSRTSKNQDDPYQHPKGLKTSK